MRINHTKLIHGALFLASAFLTACGGGGGGGSGGATPVATTYTIGGTVTGLTGTGLVLQNNGGDNLSISADGSFTFATPQASGTYQLTVLTQPSGQFCSVNPNSVTVSAANITTVAVTCAASSNTYTIGGTVTGLTGTGLVLLNNTGNNLTVSPGATTFTFSTPLAGGASYTVTVGTQPTGQTCTVTPPTNTGTVSTANITNVA
ncbi:MAG: hypothetical protein OEV15_08190, partial [Gallionella sp.]|nr:hypothetical protein [Gallionella sp.]